MRFFLLVLAFVLTAQLINTRVNAQAYSPVWINDISAPEGAVATSIVLDQTGNVFITGRFAGTTVFNLKQGGTKTLTSNGAADIFIAKYDQAAGNYIWAIGFGGDADEHPTDMVACSDGSVVIEGQYASASINFNPKGSAVLTSKGAEDVFFAKYDSNGNYVWARSIGESETDRGVALAIDKNDNIFLTGIFEGTMNADPAGGNFNLTTNQGGYCQFFAKYNSSGLIAWAHALPGGFNEPMGSPVNIDQNTGDVLIGGAISGSFDFSFNGTTGGTINSSGVTNYLAKYTNDGTFQWVKNLIVRNGQAGCRTILVDAQSNILLDAGFIGTFYPGGLSGIALTSLGINDAAIISYTSDGAYKWSDQFGGSNSSFYGNDMCLDNTGNIVFAGSFNGAINFAPGTTNGVMSSQGGEYFFISKYDASGKSIIHNAFGGSCGSNVGYRVVSNSAGVFITGGFCGTVDFDPSACKTTNLTASGSPDALVARYVVKNDTIAGVTNTITAPADSMFCTSGNPLAIIGNTPTGTGSTITYQWQTSPDGVTFTNINGATTIDYDPLALNSTTYYQRIVMSGTCGVSTSNVIAIIVNQPPAPPASIITQTCIGTAATLIIGDTQTGLTYNWYSDANRTNLVFTGTTYVTGPISINTTFYIESANTSCTSLTSATAQVIVEPLPAQPSVNNSIITTCSGTQLTLSIVNPQAGYTYKWYTDATGGTPVSTGIDFVTPILTQNTAYYAEATNTAGCISATRTPVNITVAQLPDISAQGAPACPGTSAVLSAQSLDANTTINWYADASGGSILSTGSSFTTPDLTVNTTYYAEAVDKTTGCISVTRAGATVTILTQLPVPVVTVDNTTPTSVTFQWGAVPGATGYKVSTDNGVTFSNPSSGSNGLTTTIDNLQQGQTIILIVEAVSDYSCQTSNTSAPVSAIAQYPQNSIIYVANAFTPNGDGKNDVVYVHGDGIQSMNFNIYDQFGELIFTSASLTLGWDGTYKGTKQPVGVYVYYVQALMYNGQKITKKGTITLIR